MMVSAGNELARFIQKHAGQGRKVLAGGQISYTIPDGPADGHRTVPIRNRRNGKVVWIKEEEVSYYLSPYAKPLVPGERSYDGECMFERITLAEARNPKPIVHTALPTGLNARPGGQTGKNRRRKRGKRG